MPVGNVDVEQVGSGLDAADIVLKARQIGGPQGNFGEKPAGRQVIELARGRALGGRHCSPTA